jgi:flavin reductase (DIM6/NTAB) family NADH-FMN oxidoreductase RutF/DNA-binding MarR family transcriptional regulator
MNNRSRELAVEPGADAVASGDPALDSRAFRRCLGQYATGVTIVTTMSGGRLAGVTANSFSSVSLDPPLVLWSISRRSRSFAAFEAAEFCAINILASSQIHLAQRFSGREEDKFAGVDWSAGIGGAPVLKGAVAQLECRRQASHDGGDHLILISRVLRYSTYEAEALLFAQGRYGVVEDYPDVRGVETPSDGAGLPPDAPFLTLMFQAYHAISGDFEEHRTAEGVTRSQVRALTGLSETPGLTLRDLARTKHLSDRDAEDAVAWLLDRGMLLRDPAGRLSLSPKGWTLIESINERWRQFESQQLSGLSESDVAFARRFFRMLIQRADGRERD